MRRDLKSPDEVLQWHDSAVLRSERNDSMRGSYAAYTTE